MSWFLGGLVVFWRQPRAHNGTRLSGEPFVSDPANKQSFPQLCSVVPTRFYFPGLLHGWSICISRRGKLHRYCPGRCRSQVCLHKAQASKTQVPGYQGELQGDWFEARLLIRISNPSHFLAWVRDITGMRVKFHVRKR